MNTNLRHILLSLTVIFISMSMFAAGKDDSREKFAAAQAQHIATALKLDKNTTKQFITTYCNCQKEIWQFAPQPGKPQKRNGAALTEDEARKELSSRFTSFRKFNEVQEKYYKEYSKFLTQVQILKLYEIERSQMDRMKHHQGQKPPKQKGHKPQPPQQKGRQPRK